MRNHRFQARAVDELSPDSLYEALFAFKQLLERLTIRIISNHERRIPPTHSQSFRRETGKTWHDRRMGQLVDPDEHVIAEASDQLSMTHRDSVASESLATPSALPLEIPLESIEPNPEQPRAHFDERELKWLTESVRADGVLQPILVRPLEGGRFRVIAGERRYRAAKAAGLPTIPALVRVESRSRPIQDLDVQRMALVENLQRSSLNDFEVAVGITHLVQRELGLASREETIRFLRRIYNGTVQGDERAAAEEAQRLFRTLGRSLNSFVTNQLLVFSLHTDLQNALREGRLDLSKARLLNRVENDEVRMHLMWTAIANRWTTAQMRREIVDLERVPHRTKEGESRRYQLGMRMTSMRKTYVKNRRLMPEERLAEIEDLVERIVALLEVEEHPGTP